MQPEISTLLALISGISWTLVYLELIRRGFKDKRCGMPLFALAFNLSWEFLFGFVFHTSEQLSLQTIINIIWCGFDVVIVYLYFRYGRGDFARSAPARWFLPWSLLAFVVGFATIYFSVVEFGVGYGAIYTAFAQNLMMSVLFIRMLVSREGVEGQAPSIALLKWIGTAAPTIQLYALTGSGLVLVLGAGCFVYDAIYTVMLYRKFVALGLHPWTRRPLAATA